jgi:hypothetical protein
MKSSPSFPLTRSLPAVSPAACSPKATLIKVNRTTEGTEDTRKGSPFPCGFRVFRGKKNSYQGTADYADEKDAADEWKQHQRRTEGSQSAYIRAICGKKNSCPGTADYTDETDGADEEKQHQRRTEGSQSVSSYVFCQGKR